MKNAMSLRKVISSIPSNQHILVKDYLNGVHYAVGTSYEVIHKILDYNQQLRISEVYRILIEGNNVICIEVVVEGSEVSK